MILISPYQPHEVVEILSEEVDKPPSLLRCIITLNAHYYAGTAAVCGTVSESGFELRNRSGPGFSLRARGRLIKVDEGTEIEINFAQPIFPYLFWSIVFNRYQHDREKIVSFLKEWLKAQEKAEPGAGLWLAKLAGARLPAGQHRVRHSKRKDYDVKTVVKMEAEIKIKRTLFIIFVSLGVVLIFSHCYATGQLGFEESRAIRTAKTLRIHVQQSYDATFRQYIEDQRQALGEKYFQQWKIDRSKKIQSPQLPFEKVARAFFEFAGLKILPEGPAQSDLTLNINAQVQALRTY